MATIDHFGFSLDGFTNKMSILKDFIGRRTGPDAADNNDATNSINSVTHWPLTISFILSHRASELGLVCRGHSTQSVCQCQHQCHCVLDQTFWQIIQTAFYNEFPNALGRMSWPEEGVTAPDKPFPLIGPDTCGRFMGNKFQGRKTHKTDNYTDERALFLDSDLKCPKATTWRHSYAHHTPIKKMILWGRCLWWLRNAVQS